MLIISTSDDAGRCYIETKNLDGETNKKIKFSHKDMFSTCKTEEDVSLSFAVQLF